MGKAAAPPTVHKVVLFDCRRQTCSAALGWGKNPDFKKRVLIRHIICAKHISMR